MSYQKQLKNYRISTKFYFDYLEKIKEDYYQIVDKFNRYTASEKSIYFTESWRKEISYNDLKNYQYGYLKTDYKDSICLFTTSPYSNQRVIITYVVVLNRLMNLEIPCKFDTYQVLLRVDDSIDTYIDYTPEKTPIEAFRTFLSECKKVDPDLKKEMLEFKYTDKNDALKQIHYLPECKKTNEIYKYTNCSYYDINSAQPHWFTQAFPKTRPAVEKMYSLRKQNPTYKKIMVETMGMFYNKGFKEKYGDIYEYVVQNTSRQLYSYINTLGNLTDIVYANTDGFIMTNTKGRFLQTGKNLGEIKCEAYDVNVYYMTIEYKGHRGWIMQIGDDPTKTDMIKSSITKLDRKTMIENGRLDLSKDIFDFEMFAKLTEHNNRLKAEKTKKTKENNNE